MSSLAPCGRPCGRDGDKPQGGHKAPPLLRSSKFTLALSALSNWIDGYNCSDTPFVLPSSDHMGSLLPVI